jgi:hypothetical protein
MIAATTILFLTLSAWIAWDMRTSLLDWLGSMAFLALIVAAATLILAAL